MITTTDKAVSVIKDLIILNNDRFDGYNTASKETKDQDLKSMFERFSSQSSQFNAELRAFISDEDAPDGQTSTSGKIYRAWMDVRAALATNDRKAVLASCEFGEDVALGGYKSALESEELSPEISSTVRRQQTELQDAHNTIKSMRDQA